MWYINFIDKGIGLRCAAGFLLFWMMVNNFDGSEYIFGW
jgi:hypothetical protein